MLESKNVDIKHPGAQLQLLIRYLYHEKGLREAGIVKFVDEFMRETVPYYDENRWYQRILKGIAQAKKYPLIEISSVGVTAAELEIIGTIKNDKKERLLFTLLCLAKYNNLCRDTNNNWVNFQDSVIFKLANISGSGPAKDAMIYELKEMGFITNSKNIRKPNIQVNIIDESSPAAMVIDKMEDLGLKYMHHKGDRYIKVCRGCGKYFKAKTLNKLYCKDCEVSDPTGYKAIKCAICGVETVIKARDNRTTMCPIHRAIKKRELRSLQNAAYYETHKNSVAIKPKV